MPPNPSTERPSVYEIWIEGELGEQWSAWFGGLTISPEPDTEHGPLTRLTGSIIDQAQLRGILNTLWDLNLTVLSLARMPQAERVR